LASFLHLANQGVHKDFPLTLSHQNTIVLSFK
jgi:hypothetical protein